MRLFVALDIEQDIRRRIGGFVDGVKQFAPEARWVRPESLHVTLHFIGEKPQAEVETIKRLLETIAMDSFDITFRNYGFFPNARAPRLFWVGVQAGPALAALAALIQHKLTSLNLPADEHGFTPHLTLARSVARSGNRQRGKRATSLCFQNLQDQLSSLSAPEFGAMTPRSFFLYQSQTSAGGSRYTKLAEFALR